VVILPSSGPLLVELRRRDVEVFVQENLSVITRDKYRSLSSLAQFVASIPRSAIEIARVARRVGARLIHTNTGVIVSPALAARLTGLPHIWHIRDSFQEFNRIWPIYDQYIRRCSRRVICVSSAIRDQFRTDTRVIVINNGFPPDEFEVDRESLRREFRQRHAFMNHEVIIGVVGRIKLVRKGQEHVVRAVRQLVDAGVAVRLVIVGGTAPGNEDHEHQLRELVAELGLGGIVVFTGELDDPRPAYAGMDILVLPSAQPEPFGGVVIEGMAMGLPVVATHLGGTVDQVIDGVTGFLVPPADSAAIARALRPLVDNAQLRHRMGLAGRDRMLTNFHIDTMLRRLVEVYDSCVSAPGMHGFSRPN
jgi:glycosyltransferase involved in cell wall biosynthesis